MKADLLALAAIALWGTLATLGVMLSHVPAFLLTGLSLLIGSSIALPLSRFRLKLWRVPARTLAVGVYGLFVYHFLLFMALRSAPAVEANLVNYLWPLGIVVMAPLFLPGVTLRGRHVLAAVVGFSGAAIAILGGHAVSPAVAVGQQVDTVMTAKPIAASAASVAVLVQEEATKGTKDTKSAKGSLALTSTSASGGAAASAEQSNASAALTVSRAKVLPARQGFPLGYLLAFGAAFVWSSYSLLTRRLPRFPTAAVGSFTAIAGLLSLLCHAWLEPRVTLSAADWWLTLAMGIGPMGIAFFCWDAALKTGNPHRIGLLAFTTPIISTVLLLLSTHRPLSWNIALAAALVIGAAVVGSRE